MAALAQISLIAFVLMVSGCANPLNQVTSDRYAEQCSEAERAGQLAVAEEACYRALVNVDWGNLGPLLKIAASLQFCTGEAPAWQIC